jgi:hypothetical protein
MNTASSIEYFKRSIYAALGVKTMIKAFEPIGEAIEHALGSEGVKFRVNFDPVSMCYTFKLWVNRYNKKFLFRRSVEDFTMNEHERNGTLIPFLGQIAEDFVMVTVDTFKKHLEAIGLR